MKADLKWLEDPKIFEVNRCKAHSDHRFVTSDGFLRYDLNGIWKFSYSETIEARPKDFYKLDYDVFNFDDIVVPGHIELQGYGKPQYINCQYPWDATEKIVPPELPKKSSPVASYVTFFDLEETFKNKRIFISFRGVQTAFYVYLNGEFIGYSEDSFTPSEFEITDYVLERDNKLAVEVHKYSTATWLEDQDYWRFTGIFRDVFIYAIPKVHVRDIKIHADYDYVNNTGVLSASCDILGDDYKTRYILKEVNGKAVYMSFDEPRDVILNNIKPWSAEEPNLYELCVELTVGGDLIEVASAKVGFRTFELKDGLMLLNGKRIVFNGVDRHEFNCHTGRVISSDDIIYDIKLMKQNNINAVRTSHYPNISYFYDLCDEYGIYVIDEANLETHGTWNQFHGADCSHNAPGSDMRWLGAVIDRATSMVERDKNHPCVLIWSCGNESNCGDVIAKMCDYYHEVDSRRLVHYEGVFYNRKYDSITDMESRMYAKPWEVEAYIQAPNSKPYILCEYMHAMGNSCGDMASYTSLVDKYQKYQGGFIWDFIDQAIFKEDENGNKYLAYGGDFDDRPTDYEFCGNGIVTADRKPTAKLFEVKHLYSNISLALENNTLTIRNKNLFKDTSDYIFRVVLKKEESVINEWCYEKIVAPLSTDVIILDDDMILDEGEYVYTATVNLKEDTFWASANHEIDFTQMVVNVKNQEQKPLCEKPELVYGDFNIGVVGNDFKVIFGKKEAGIVSLLYNGKEHIVKAPNVTFFRAFTDNDNGNGSPFRFAQWEIASRYARCEYEKTIVIEKDDSYEIAYSFITPTNPVITYEVTYNVYFDGSVKVKLDYPGVDGMPSMPLIGMEFMLKGQYSNFTYYGLGDVENYWDRKSGVKLDVYSSTAKKNLTPYLNPQECGNRCDVRYVNVYDKYKNGLSFSYVKEPFEMSVLPYSAYELNNARHQNELPNSKYTWVRILGKQMGVGGDDSWGAHVHNEFLIDSKEPYSFEFVISKFSK